MNCNVFASVGAYEPEKVANVEEFANYLKAGNYKGLNYQTLIIPGIAHGAALAPVMESAMKFAYCHLHKKVLMPSRKLAKYVGNYRNPQNPKLKLNMFLKKHSLYLRVGNIKIDHLIPCATGKFFMYENERLDISFYNKNGKKYFLFATKNEKLDRIDKID